MNQANKKLTKRQMRDGISTKKNIKKQSTGKRQLNGAAVNQSDSIKASAKNQFKVSRAKKMVQRTPNLETQQRARNLKAQRIDLDQMEPVRIQKALAASGVGSRREMEQWITQGLVRVNGKAAQLGDRITPDDEVTVRGSIINIKWPDRLPRIMVYYKQEGEIVSRDDPQGRVSIFDRLPQTASSRWVAIGRLDINTSGLLILTTSGELVNRFAHPSFEVEREYAVRVLGELTDGQKHNLLSGVQLEDGIEVRRLFESQGLTVSRLVRVRFGPIALPTRLKRGQYYELNELEVANIMSWAGLQNVSKQRRR